MDSRALPHARHGFPHAQLDNPVHVRPIDNPVRHGSASWASTCVSWVCIMRPHTRPCATLGRTLAHGITHKAKPHAPCYERVGQHLGARWATTHTPPAHGLAQALCERETACAGLCVGADGSAYMRDRQPRKWVRDRGTPLVQARISTTHMRRVRMHVGTFT